MNGIIIPAHVKRSLHKKASGITESHILTLAQTKNVEKFVVKTW